MDKYDLELENLSRIIGVSVQKVNDKKMMELTERNYLQAKFVLFELQPKDEQEESRKQIEQLKKAKTEELPAIAMTTNGSIVDGLHRVMALWENGVRKFEVLVITKR